MLRHGIDFLTIYLQGNHWKILMQKDRNTKFYSHREEDLSFKMCGRSLKLDKRSPRLVFLKKAKKNRYFFSFLTQDFLV